MNILVTGATGFVGNALIKHLVENKHDVSVIVRTTSDTARILEGVDVYPFYGGIESMNSIMERAKPDVVVHLASLFISQHKPEQVVELIRSNVEFGSILLEAMVENRVKNFVNTGTSWQHYNNEDYCPVNLYAATKQAFESVLKFYVEAKGFNAINLHLFDSYGANDTRPKLLSFLKNIMNDNKELDMSPGEQEILLVNIDDLANGYQCAIEYLVGREDKTYETYSIANCEDVCTLKELVEKIKIITGKNLRVNFGKREYREREVFKVWSDYKTIPGWESNVEFDEGLSRYFDEKKIVIIDNEIKIAMGVNEK